MSRTWFITGANRGFGYEIARTALAVGDRVVATARQPDQVRAALSGYGDHLLAVRLDVTDRAGIQAAVRAAIDRFGRIDVLVNNAGYGQLGVFEEITPEQIERQFATNVFGVFDVTRAVLPILRRQRPGHIFTIASIAGITGGAGSTIYGATKFAVTGWSEGLAQELQPFGITVTVVHPGMFRTDFLDPSSVSHGELPIEDYRTTADDRRAWLDRMNHAQPGDPAQFGPAILQLVTMADPPVRVGLGSDAIAAFTERAEQLTGSVTDFGELTRSTDHHPRT